MKATSTNPAATHAAMLILDGEFQLMDARQFNELMALMSRNRSDRTCERALAWLWRWHWARQKPAKQK
jgi:hypothetical protein